MDQFKKHEHKWELMAHMDGCHYYSTNYRCTVKDCKAVRVVNAERSMKSEDDPYAAVWAREDCKRCEELLGGAAPEIHMYNKDGNPVPLEASPPST